MRRLAFVDCLRGLASFYVLVFHMTIMPVPALTVPPGLSRIILAGGSGVTMFFIVSAFSLCHAMQAHDEPAGVVRNFYIRRFFRIAPLFYVMLAVFLLYFRLAYSTVPPPGLILENLAFLFNFIPNQEGGLVWDSWTIGVEMPFYVIFPLLFFKALSVRRLIGCFLLAVFAAYAEHFVLSRFPGIHGRFFMYGLPRHLPVFILGMIAWLVFDRVIAQHGESRGEGLLLIAASLLAYLGLLFVPGGSFGYYLVAVSYIGLLFGLALTPVSLFVNPVTQLLGRLSYSTYLIHPLIICALYPVYRRFESLGLPISLRFCLCLAVTLAAVLPVAGLSYRWIEKPGMAFGKRFLLAARQPATEVVGLPN